MKRYHFTIEIWNELRNHPESEDVDHNEIQIDNKDVKVDRDIDDDADNDIEITDTITGHIYASTEEEALEKLETAIDRGDIEIPYCHSTYVQDLELDDDNDDLNDVFHLLPDVADYRHPVHDVYHILQKIRHEMNVQIIHAEMDDMKNIHVVARRNARTFALRPFIKWTIYNVGSETEPKYRDVSHGHYDLTFYDAALIQSDAVNPEIDFEPGEIFPVEDTTEEDLADILSEDLSLELAELEKENLLMQDILNEGVQMEMDLKSLDNALTNAPETALLNEIEASENIIIDDMDIMPGSGIDHPEATLVSDDADLMPESSKDYVDELLTADDTDIAPAPTKDGSDNLLVDDLDIMPGKSVPDENESDDL